MSEKISPNISDTFPLLIEKLLHGGDALAHLGTRVCFVKDVIPGEEVLARVDAVKKDFLITSPLKLLSKSSNRIKPPCPHFYLCGGCQWQHIKYEHQLYWKKEIVKECLARIGSLKDMEVSSVIASPSELNYRSRTALKVGAENETVCGYYKSKSHDIIPVKKCALLVPPLNNALKKCSRLLQADPVFFKDITELDMVFINDSDQVIISLKDAKNRNKSKFLFSNASDDWIPYDKSLNDEIMGMQFRRDIDSFYQVNFLQNIRMIKLVQKYFAPLKKSKILDLYCGCGNFSLFLASQADRVIGIDSNGYAVKQAQLNAAQNNISNCIFIKADIDRTGPLLNDNFDAVLLNPPRSGCRKATLRHIAGCNPAIVVYVSCNPATLARDLLELVKAGFQVAEIQPLDMFPQTYHIETLVKLIRR